MNELQIFNNSEFGEIRAIEIDGEGWFVGVDVAAALGYAKPRGAVARNVDEDDSRVEGVIDSLGRTQQTKVINESGVYSLIILSTIPSAKKFKRWVTSEVLPSLRKHGTYTMQPTTPAQLMLQQAQLMVDMEQRINTMESLVLDVGVKAEQAIAKAENAIKVYATPDKDHWVEDMCIAIKDLMCLTGWVEPKLRGSLYDELENTAGHTNINTRLKRLRDRMKKTGMTYRDAQSLTKLDAIAADRKLRVIFESIVRRRLAQAA